jgi:hypothetical protein
MKSLIRLPQDLVVAVVVLGIIIFSHRHHTAASKPPTPATVTAVPVQAAKPSLDLTPGTTRAVTSIAAASAPKTFEETMALIHLKLRQWSETQTGDRETQDRLQNELQAMLTDDNAAKIIQSLSPEELEGPFGTAALFHWMKTDPITAANWIASRPDATEDQAWVVAHNLLTDGVDLHNYSDQLPDTGWKQTFLADAGLAVLSKSPLEAVNLAQQMNPGSAQTNLLQTVASDWISNDPNKALDWILSVNDPAMQEQLIAAGAKAYATSDPQLAAEWLVSTVKSDTVLKNTLPNIIEIWSAKDPDAASRWLLSVSDPASSETPVDLQ